jgi:hypothetical protein
MRWRWQSRDEVVTIRRITLVAAVVVWACSSATAQKAEVFSRIEGTFRTNEPTWKLEKVLHGPTDNPATESFTFRQGTKQASIDVWIWLTAKDAHEMFSGQVIAMDNTRGSKNMKRDLANLGDENYLWANPHSDAWPTIHFRKGNVFVSVFAPTIPLAERFAHYVLDEISQVQ